MGVLVGCESDISQRCILLVVKTYHLQSYITKSIDCRSREGILYLYLVLVMPHLEHYLRLWPPPSIKWLGSWSTFHMRRVWGIWVRLDVRRLKEDLILAFYCLEGYSTEKARLATEVQRRGHKNMVTNCNEQNSSSSQWEWLSTRVFSRKVCNSCSLEYFLNTDEQGHQPTVPDPTLKLIWL